ncbi:MAG: terminase small subunit [Algiphilus sp.]|uniref:terminase small subunit n=1 Tax=Algiphilus sp. TaxID=1872431 RepID=UPI0032F01EF7
MSEPNANTLEEILARLNAKQRAFVFEYLVDMNATQAAIRAGYSPRTAKSQGQRLLTNADIAAAIQAAQEQRQERTEITADRVVRELSRMALYDPADIVRHHVTKPEDIAELPEDVRRAIIGWSWDRHGNFVLKLSPKTPSLDLLARHLGMLRDRTVLENPDGSALQAPVIYLPDNGRGGESGSGDANA